MLRKVKVKNLDTYICVWCDRTSIQGREGRDKARRVVQIEDRQDGKGKNVYSKIYGSETAGQIRGYRAEYRTGKMLCKE